MTLTKAQLLSVGAALRHAEQSGVKPGDIERVALDDTKVEARDARAALAQAEQELAAARAKAEADANADKMETAEKPNVFARAWSSISGTASEAASWTNDNVLKPSTQWLDENAPAVTRAGNAVWQATESVAFSDPEQVARKATVHLALKGGRTVDIPVLVFDETTTKVLRATSATAGGANLIPVIGNFVQGGTGLVSALASGASYLFGDAELGRAFWGMAKKHTTLGLVGFIPGMGIAAGAAAARDAQRFSDGVPLDQLVDKGTAQAGGG